MLLLPACSLPLSHAQADQGFILKPSFSFPARYSNGPSSTSVVLLELFLDPIPAPSPLLGFLSVSRISSALKLLSPNSATLAFNAAVVHRFAESQSE